MPSDSELMRRARRDPTLFGAIAEAHYDRVYSACLRETGQPEVAADLTAETLAQALCSLRRFRPPADGSGSALPWLLGIARNVARHYHRDQRVERAARERLGMPIQHDDATYDEADTRLDAAAQSGALEHELEQLNPAEQAAIRGRVIEERSYDELAHELGITPNAARIRVSRGLARLSSRLRGTSR